MPKHRPENAVVFDRTLNSDDLQKFSGVLLEDLRLRVYEEVKYKTNVEFYSRNTFLFLLLPFLKEKYSIK